MPNAVATPAVHVREPDTATVLAFTTAVDGSYRLVAMGPRTRASYLAPKSVALCVQLPIRTGRARPVLGVAVHELADRIVDLRELWGAPARHLADELARLGPDVERIELRLAGAVADRLAARSSAELARADLVREAARRLVGAPGRLPEVARSVGVSERHLRALFTDGVGMAPKQFSSIRRVRGILDQLGPGDGWAALAARAGYYDQSHLTAEFRGVMGVPPGAYRAGRLPAAAPCSA
ncbi:helix-turn-helix domain-containing protein [Pseudonocardia sp. GCM10023141]|uniref:helix-turn-helix domain-containing protein n=1 Tax=Pseudonocardia sp. GCM10023141 TaxID=3252653 RepID=UPI003611C9B9